MTGRAAQDDMIGQPDDAELERLLEADPGEVPEERWTQSLVDMIRVQEAMYRRRGYSEDEAFALARDGVMALAEYFGARMWYLPRGDRLRAALRDAEIYRRAKRGNIRDLAMEFGLSEPQIYRINRQQKALHLKKIQGRLFDDEGGA